MTTAQVSLYSGPSGWLRNYPARTRDSRAIPSEAAEPVSGDHSPRRADQIARFWESGPYPESGASVNHITDFRRQKHPPFVWAYKGRRCGSAPAGDQSGGSTQAPTARHLTDQPCSASATEVASGVVGRPISVESSRPSSNSAPLAASASQPAMAVARPSGRPNPAKAAA